MDTRSPLFAEPAGLGLVTLPHTVAVLRRRDLHAEAEADRLVGRSGRERVPGGSFQARLDRGLRPGAFFARLGRRSAARAVIDQARP